MEPQQWRRKNKNTEATEAPGTGVHDIPDDLLRLILLRLDSPLWLARAASTCRRWRAAVSADGGALLRLARSLHPPAVVGHYHHRGGPITFVPTSPAAPIDARRFSLHFLLPLLEDTSRWEVADSHGGLVLLIERHRQLPDLVVCNPLTQQYRKVERPPAKLAGRSVGHVCLLDGDDGGGGGDISVSRFRVLYRFDDLGPLRACVFSSTSGDGWRSLPSSVNDLDRDCVGHLAGWIDGSLYLGMPFGMVMALDTATMAFSWIDLPTHVDPSQPLVTFSSFRVVHGGPAVPPTARIVHANGEGLEVFRRRGGEWALERSVPRLSEVARGLPSYLAERPFRWKVKVVADGVGLAVVSAAVEFDRRKWFFTVDVDTMEVQFVPESSYHLYRGTTATSTYVLPYVV